MIYLLLSSLITAIWRPSPTAKTTAKILSGKRGSFTDPIKMNMVTRAFLAPAKRPRR